MSKHKSIDRTIYPPQRLTLDDWRIYIKCRNEARIPIIRKLNEKINQVLQQKLA